MVFFNFKPVSRRRAASAIRIADVREGGWRPHRARRQDTASNLEYIVMFIRASFGQDSFMWPTPCALSGSSTPVPLGTGAFLIFKTKIPSSTIRDEGIPPWYHPAYVQNANVSLIAVTGLPVTGYLIHQRSLPYGEQASSVF
ncbi:MAG TPA: hypothetical protein VIN60_02320 [Anaerolineales bacterium]